MIELEKRFSTDAAPNIEMAEWLCCPQCNGQEAWQADRGLFRCVNCGTQTSVTSGTILHGARKPLPIWFRAMWHITNQKYGANALGLQRLLGLRS